MLVILRPLYHVGVFEPILRKNIEKSITSKSTETSNINTTTYTTEWILLQQICPCVLIMFSFV